MSILFTYYNIQIQKNTKKLFTKLKFYSNLDNGAFLKMLKEGKKSEQSKFMVMA